MPLEGCERIELGVGGVGYAAGVVNRGPVLSFACQDELGCCPGALWSC